MISRQKAIKAFGKQTKAFISNWSSKDEYYELGKYTQWCKDVKALENLPTEDVVDRKELIETIKHYAQYPDGMSKLLEVYQG